MCVDGGDGILKLALRARTHAHTHARRALFKKFDEDNSGTIDSVELKKMATIILHSDQNATPRDITSDMEYLMKVDEIS